jgi:hypothetical protein
MVVASLKSWDGIRILGVFDTEDAANKACESLDIDTDIDNYNLDFVEINKISMCQTIIVDHNSHGKSFRRMHVYKDGKDKSKEITEK